jgi:hypothetical protein
VPQLLAGGCVQRDDVAVDSRRRSSASLKSLSSTSL